MGTEYHEMPEFELPEGWEDTPEGKRLRAIDYARDLRKLAADFEECDPPEGVVPALHKHRLWSAAGETIIKAHRDGFLSELPKLGELVAWHTASSDNDPTPGVDVAARRARCPYNLFLDVVGGGRMLASLKVGVVVKAGSPLLASDVHSIEPAPVDGVLPGLGKVERGDAVEACRYLADVIGQARAEPPPSPSGGEPFTPLQEAIWKSLDGRGLTKEKLADEVCGGDGRRLYRSGALNEMRKDNLVGHKRGVGYYRFDSPPAPK